jgi:hypothetical protein
MINSRHAISHNDRQIPFVALYTPELFAVQEKDTQVSREGDGARHVTVGIDDIPSRRRSFTFFPPNPKRSIAIRQEIRDWRKKASAGQRIANRLFIERGRAHAGRPGFFYAGDEV